MKKAFCLINALIVCVYCLFSAYSETKLKEKRQNWVARNLNLLFVVTLHILIVKSSLTTCKHKNPTIILDPIAGVSCCCCCKQNIISTRFYGSILHVDRCVLTCRKFHTVLPLDILFFQRSNNGVVYNFRRCI